MKQAEFVLDRDYVISEIDDRLYSTFLEHAGQIVYGGLYDPNHPTADEQGFRKDVIEAVKALRVPAIRYPGGNFVSNFDWKDSIGPRESRPTRLELAYMALETNEVGLDEYVDWARKTDTEVMYTLNLGNPDCAKDAGFLMDYCNFPGGTAWSDQRIKNGRKAPHNIKTWCLGNEMDGSWQLNAQTAENYALRACETAKIMKWTDPEAQLVVVGSSNPETKYPWWDRVVLEHCFKHVDYLSIHRYFPLMRTVNERNPDIVRYLGSGVEMANYINVIAATIDYAKAKTRSKNDVYISFDEYAPVGGPPLHLMYEASDGNPRSAKPFQLESQVFETRSPKTVLDALAIGSMLIALMNSADKVKIACQSIMLHSLIKAFKGKGVVKQTMYYPFQHASLYGRGVALQGVVKSAAHHTDLISWSYDREIDIPLVQTSSVLDPATGDVNIFMLNADSEEMQVKMDLRSFEGLSMKEHLVFCHDDPYAYNDYDCPNNVVPKSQAPADGGSVPTVVLAPRSWNVLRFAK